MTVRPRISTQATYNQSVDVYAFGMCLYEMATGRVPYAGKAAQEIPYIVAVEKRRPELPTETEANYNPALCVPGSSFPSKVVQALVVPR